MSRTVRHILVPVDLSALGEAKLPVVQEYARAFDADVLLLHVLPKRALAPDVVRPEEGTARAYLDVLCGGMTTAGVRAAPVIRTGPTAATIVDEARARQVDLVILGANVRPRLQSVVIGSVADEVVRAAPCPVLLVRPTLEAGAAPPLRSFDEDATRAGPLRRRSLGVRQVEVGRIIGSVGRARELGSDFRPRKRRPATAKGRFERIRDAMAAGEILPPVELYKLGFGYYVLDGNHRVAAAKALGVLEIDADVTELVPLADREASHTFAERRAFERSTGLGDVGAAHAESYKRLGEMIDAYRGERGIDDYRAAAQRWYADVYHPLWQRVRQQRLTDHFPGDRSADVIARLGAWRAGPGKDEAASDDWQHALDRFAATLPRGGATNDDDRVGAVSGETAPPVESADTGRR